MKVIIIEKQNKKENIKKKTLTPIANVARFVDANSTRKDTHGESFRYSRRVYNVVRFLLLMFKLSAIIQIQVTA